MVEGNCLYRNITGSGTQYRCAKTLYILSLLACRYSRPIIIDCAVVSPDHGKNLVHGLNAVDEHHLKIIMWSIKTAQEEDKNI